MCQHWPNEGELFFASTHPAEALALDSSLCDPADRPSVCPSVRQAEESKANTEPYEKGAKYTYRGQIAVRLRLPRCETDS